ncbi:hypothetical protein PPEP_a4398 [Pseudoalteromonas peptidolytica F12-50-A1]|uniref:Uncharacterized protein n=1 Tax=Pseudoalteromonas peptidolytica F12-50-A1 TaxID=1315280 RepID=A0A8I0MXW0_9GAMM|nr:hypothetical protein [Pseudoalteromonas peptidolytica F12-50-A1]
MTGRQSHIEKTEQTNQNNPFYQKSLARYSLRTHKDREKYDE